MTNTATAPVSPTADDPWDAVDNPRFDPTFTARGRLVVETPWRCALVKGQGKVVFDPAVHQVEQMATAFSITIEALLDGQRDTEREMIAESAEFARIVNPSFRAMCKAAGFPDRRLRELHGSYVEAQLIPSGRKYRANDGTEREATTFKFIRLFKDEAECLAAAQAGRRPTVTEQGIAELNASKAAATPVPAVNGAVATATAERKSLAVFLPALWDQAGHDVAKFLAVLAANPQLAKHFPVDSPEVMALVLPASTPAEEAALPF